MAETGRCLFVLEDSGLSSAAAASS